MKPVGILGVGRFLPPTILTNQDIVNKGLDTSDEWILERTGIRERRVAGKITSSDMAYEAAKDALSDAGLTAHDIDLIIVATTTPDYPQFPSTACLVQKRLGMRNVGAFDLSAACSGFNFALTTGVQYVRSGAAKRVLVVASDCLTNYVDWTDRSICILFGDAAGAVVLGEVENGYGELASSMYSDGGHADILKNNGPFIYMDGRAVFKVANHAIIPSVQETLEKAKLSVSDLNYFISHQANIRIIRYSQEKLGLSDAQVLTNIETCGNTSAASIPLVMAENKQRFKKGDTLALVGFGAGFTWGVTILRWSK